MREEIRSLEVVKLKLRTRISELEDEVRTTRLALEEQSFSKSSTLDDDNEVLLMIDRFGKGCLAGGLRTA